MTIEVMGTGWTEHLTVRDIIESELHIGTVEDTRTEKIIRIIACIVDMMGEEACRSIFEKCPELSAVLLDD